MAFEPHIRLSYGQQSNRAGTSLGLGIARNIKVFRSRSWLRNEPGFMTPLVKVMAQLLGQFKHEVNIERMRGL